MRKDLDPRFLKAASRKQGGFAGWAAAAAGVYSATQAGKGGGSTTSTQDSAPWAAAAPHLANSFDEALKLYRTNTVLGGQSQNTGLSQGLMANRALGGNPLNQAAQQENLKTIRGDYTDLANNPAAQNAMNSARSQINSQFSGDNYGNSAHQEWLNKGLMQAASPFYESERQRQVGATALSPTLANQDYTDLGMLGQVGQQQDARLQQQQMEPWMRLQAYQGVVNGSPGGSTTSQQPYFTNPAASAMGGALGGLGLYNSMNQGGLLGRGGTGYNPNANYSGQNLAQPDYSGGFY